MDVAAIVLTASLIIVILQVVSIVLIVKNKKNDIVKPEAVPAQPAQSAPEPRDFRKRRDDNRFNRKPGFEQRQKPVAPQPPQAVDYVEKSLRDINLKLKNAERDQEDARKKIKDDIQSPSQNQNSERKPDNNQNRSNRGRDDDFRRRDRNGRPNNSNFRDRDQNQNRNSGRDQGRNQGRDQGRDRYQGIDKPQTELAPTQTAQPQTNEFSPSPVRALPEVPPTQIGAGVAPKPTLDKEILSPVPENTEVLHGRKVLVRRRILTPEEQAAKNASETPASTIPEASQGAAVPPPPTAAQESSANASSSLEDEPMPIRFGR